MTLRCAIYTRKSTEEGLEQAFNSLDAQREACEAYIKSQAHEGWRLVRRRYDDGGFSGGDMKRPALTQLLSDVSAGKIDVIVVYKVDQLTRSLADFARIVDRLDAKKASFVAVTQSFNTTSSMGRLTLNMLLSFAQFEREVTSERIRDKVAASKAKGIWMGGTPPLGYRCNNGALIIVPAEADLVRRIFGRYLDLGGLVALANDLAASGDRSMVYVAGKGRVGRSVPFQMAPLIHILRNPTYLGEVRHKQARYAGQHEPIVSRAVWDAAQGQLDKRSHRGRGAGAHDDAFVLRGLVFDRDGSPLRLGRTEKPSGQAYRYYLAGDVAAGSSILRIPAGKLEATVERAITEHFATTVRVDWRRLPRTKRQRRTRQIVRRIEVEQDLIHLTLDLRRLKDAPPRKPGRPRKGEPGPIEKISIPMTVRRFNPPTIAPPTASPGAKTRASPERSLVVAVAQAHVWRAKIEGGKVAHVADLAAAHGVGLDEIERLLPLAYLSPDITAAILAGRQDPTCNLDSLSSAIPPMCWADQAARFLSQPQD